MGILCRDDDFVSQLGGIARPDHAQDDCTIAAAMNAEI
jgi:hypothetical protein